MPRKRCSPGQIISKLREAEVLLAQGKTTAEVSRLLGITEHTYYRWRKEYGGRGTQQALRLKELEKENAWLSAGWRFPCRKMSSRKRQSCWTSRIGRRCRRLGRDEASLCVACFRSHYAILSTCGSYKCETTARKNRLRIATY
jgi:putative transposase